MSEENTTQVVVADVNPSGLLCLHSLVVNLHRNVNFDALMTDGTKKKYADAPCDTLLELAQGLELRPERKEDVEETAKVYNGPALLKLKDNHWICIPQMGQFNGDAPIRLFDPMIQGQQKTATGPKEKILSLYDGELIIFRNLQPVDNKKFSGLFCLTSIARHHQVNMDIRRLMHEYAIGENEPTVMELLEMASSYGLKTKQTRVRWKDFPRIGQAYPMLGVKRDGKYVVFCGWREDKDGNGTLAVVDPSDPPEQPGQQFRFYTEDEFKEKCTGKAVFLKKIYKLSDEEQPFSLLWFMPEFIKLKGLFFQIAMLVVMMTVIALITPLFFQIVVDKVIVHQAMSTLNTLGIGIVIAILFNGILDFLRSYLLLFATNKIDISLATKTFRHLMRLPIEFYERVPSGVLLKHMQQTEKIRGFLSGNLFFTILDVFSLFLFVPFLYFYSPTLTFVVLGFSAAMALVIAALVRPFQRRLNELYQAEGKRQSMLVESIHGIRTVKSLALEPVEERLWDNSSAYAIKSYFRVGKISMTAKSISQVLEMLMTVCVIWVGVYLVRDKIITVGALIAFQMLAGRVTGPLVRMVGLIHEYQQIALSVRMLGVVMNTPLEPAGGGVRNVLKGNIEFDNVTFQYRPDTPQVIRNFSLKIDQGMTVGIVGRSGSGKTTLTKLLQGLYPVQSGLIKIDGIDLREIDKAHLRSSIGVVLQENYFFNGTVRENISLTKRSAALEEIIYAAKLAGADEFVQKLPKGYDTMLEENASNLSGGQKQRLAIARALLTNPPILIFDEATSALDPESETVIQNNLAAIARGRTVLIISHRLSIVSNATKILVIDNGERTAFASHRELLAMPGTYSEFWHQQMERHLEK